MRSRWYVSEISQSRSWGQAFVVGQWSHTALGFASSTFCFNNKKSWTTAGMWDRGIQNVLASFPAVYRVLGKRLVRAWSMHSTTRERSKFTEEVLLFSLCRPIKKETKYVHSWAEKESESGRLGCKQEDTWQGLYFDLAIIIAAHWDGFPISSRKRCCHVFFRPAN